MTTDADIKDAPQEEGAAQPLAAGTYVVIAALGLVLAAGFTLFYIYRVPAMIANGVAGQIFYLLLIPWALACSAFLFGAMKSYASLTHQRLGSIQLGGPAALFCLVLVGGFKLVPPAPATFDLAVRAHSVDNPLLTTGEITLDLPGLPHANIGPDGEANFKTIAARYRALPLRVLPHVPGYQASWIEGKIEGNVIDVALTKEHFASVLEGTILPPPRKGAQVKIVVDGQPAVASPDELGRFTLDVSGKGGDRVRMKVYSDAHLVYDDYQVLPGPVTISLNKTR